MRGTVDSYRVRTKHSQTGKYERWRIRWDLPPNVQTDERRRGSRRGFATRKAAEAALAEILGQVHAGTYVAPSRQRLGPTCSPGSTGWRSSRPRWTTTGSRQRSTSYRGLGPCRCRT